MTALLASLTADQALTALVLTACLLTAADFVVGVSAAIRSGTFKLDQIAAFVQTHVVGRVLPIVTLAVLGHWEAALMAIAATAAAAYALETLGSIRDDLMLPAQAAH